MVGGLGICGRPLCCGSFLREFQPVSIKMAKTQNLSLNPTKISGTCGRLMCCLKYEQEAYEDAVRRMPKNDSFVETPDGVGDVCQVDLLKERVKVRLDSAPETPKCYRNCEICVVRNGKGKRAGGLCAPRAGGAGQAPLGGPGGPDRAPRPPARERSALEEALERVFQAADEEAAPLREKKNAEHSRGRSGSAGGKSRRGPPPPRRGKRAASSRPGRSSSARAASRSPAPSRPPARPGSPRRRSPGSSRPRPPQLPPAGGQAAPQAGRPGTPHRRRPGGKPPPGRAAAAPKGSDRLSAGRRGHIQHGPPLGAARLYAHTLPVKIYLTYAKKGVY